MEPEIRLLEMGDRERMVRFFGQMGTHARMFFNRNNGNFNGTMRFFDGKDGSSIIRWVAVQDDEIVGYVFLWDTNTKIPWLGIATAECMRGKGLGPKLMAHAEKWCRENDKGGIMLTTALANIYAQILYEKSGYQQMGIYKEYNEILYLNRF